MTTQQPEALRLASELLTNIDGHSAIVPHFLVRQAADELRRLHAESELHLQELRSYRITVENREARIVELEAQLAAAQHGVPQGWKLVPEVPTMEMVDAGDKSHKASSWLIGGANAVPATYTAMLASAPQPPAGQQAAHKSALGDEGKALAALRYYMHECSGAEPSISVFHRMAEEALEAAEPQPPEAAQLDDINVVDMEQAVDSTEAAPVQMPEPEWWINYCAATSKETASRIQESELASAPLYTEHQVRQLLAQHGIK